MHVEYTGHESGEVHVVGLGREVKHRHFGQLIPALLLVPFCSVQSARVALEVVHQVATDQSTKVILVLG